MLDSAKLANPKGNTDSCLPLLWQKTLFDPLEDLLSRPKKDIRGKLINVGYALAQSVAKVPNEDTLETLQICARLVEYLHSGSLIIDDIQDASEIRRGAPTLHLKYGLPTALNAGNWLYFYAFELIKDLKIDDSTKLQMLEAVQNTLLNAHFGQALDVGVCIDQMLNSDIVEVCKTNLELKSGALMSLSFQLGAIVSGAESSRLKIIASFGKNLGVVLQMFDDLGNLRPDRPTAKHLEDLSQRRPSFVWWYLAEQEPQLLFKLRFAASGLPHTELLEQFLATTNVVERARTYARSYFENLFEHHYRRQPPLCRSGHP